METLKAWTQNNSKKKGHKGRRRKNEDLHKRKTFDTLNIRYPKFMHWVMWNGTKRFYEMRAV